MEKQDDHISNYIRVGYDYFKSIKAPDRYGIMREELIKWKKDEIATDFGRSSIYEIAKYDKFVIVPDNVDYKSVIGRCYNLYKPFSHIPKKGDWKWTKILLQHVFEEQYEIGLKYIQCLYVYPRQTLPVLALVSKTRSTGKSTFLDWLTTLFGGNMVVIGAKDISSDFNAVYATSNIVGIEETFIDKTNTIEKIKAISTQKTMTVNMKMIQHFSVPFFGKIIMNSNNENRFIKIDQSEIRFFVRKLGIPKIKNHNILEDMISEIPAFLNHLINMPKIDTTKDSRQVFTVEQLSNETLTKVKEESKSWLYKELKEMFKEFFYENQSLEKRMFASPIDIKNKFFKHNNQVQLSYIKNVLRDEFEFDKTPKVVRYSPFFTDNSKAGTPYLINKNLFIDDAIEIEDVVEEEELPF